MTLTGRHTHPQPCVVTIGSFDGVHQGHQFVVRQVLRQARDRGLGAVVVTFAGHPLQVLRPGFQPQLLTPADEKVERLLQTGIDSVALLDFTPALARMSAHDFMRTVLKEQLQARVLVVGYDNHFGHGPGGFQAYVESGQTLGIEVVGCEAWQGGTHVSSTAIRQALLAGDVSAANQGLGYPYALRGAVVEGFHNGHKIGYPTANLQVPPHKLVPACGSYLVATPHGPGMLNIGTRPTLHNGNARSVEVHILDFAGDVYGQTLRINLLRRLRPEREFGSLAALRQQLQDDERLCRQWWADYQMSSPASITD